LRRILAGLFRLARSITPKRLRKVPLILAYSDEDEGAAALAMILAFHGIEVDFEELQSRMNDPIEARADALSILETARHHGLRAQGMQVQEPSQIPFLPRPAILHLSTQPGSFPRPIDASLNEHRCRFYILEGLARGAYKLIDPYDGPTRMEREVLDRHFTGVALVFER
jgi:ABC-type bacteriocin/lantibiotic exporter with double-glycine peptidase domain